MKTWAYGVTTVPERLGTLLPRTLESLKQAGFDQPRVFIDGTAYPMSHDRLCCYPLTCRFPAVRTVANWMLSLWELYLREPTADRYAIFQDDLVAVKGLRQYLDACEYPRKGYWNLYTVPGNLGFSGDKQGWHKASRDGKGALGLVFSREAVVTLSQQQYFLVRPQDTRRGHQSIDGAVWTAFKNASWTEYVHSPSLLQHTGNGRSSMEHPVNASWALSDCFPGEGFDATSLFKQPEIVA